MSIKTEKSSFLEIKKSKIHIKVECVYFSYKIPLINEIGVPQLKIILVRYRNKKFQFRYSLQSNIDTKISSNYSACMISMQIFWDFILRISNIDLQIFPKRPPEICCVLAWAVSARWNWCSSFKNSLESLFPSVKPNSKQNTQPKTQINLFSSKYSLINYNYNYSKTINWRVVWRGSSAMKTSEFSIEKLFHSKIMCCY